MNIGDKVTLAHDVFAASVKGCFATGPGVIKEVHYDWQDEDIICWDVSVEMPDGHIFGFYYSDLVVVE